MTYIRLANGCSASLTNQETVTTQASEAHTPLSILRWGHKAFGCCRTRAK